MGRSPAPHPPPGTAPLQGTLGGAEQPAVDVGARSERIALDPSSWVEVTRAWLRGADTLLEALVSDVDWHQGRRRMSASSTSPGSRGRSRVPRCCPIPR